MSISQNKKIKNLISEIKRGNGKAANELLFRYRGLIYKTCSTLHARYRGLIAIDDLINDAKNIVVYLAAMEYIQDGKARFPYFIKTHLHARLTQLCRPTVAFRKQSVELKPNVTDNKQPLDELYQQEREEVIIQINNFMWRTFTDQELDIVVNGVIGGQSRYVMAKKYHVSQTRMKFIWQRTMDKLRKFLKKMGIKNIHDV